MAAPGSGVNCLQVTAGNYRLQVETTAPSMDDDSYAGAPHAAPAADGAPDSVQDAVEENWPANPDGGGGDVGTIGPDAAPQDGKAPQRTQSARPTPRGPTRVASTGVVWPRAREEARRAAVVLRREISHRRGRTTRGSFWRSSVLSWWHFAGSRGPDEPRGECALRLAARPLILILPAPILAK